jgi:site-specific DNA recombinase
MKTDDLLTKKFGKMPEKIVLAKIDKPNVVIYTRVSTKEQSDNNMSLETQRKTIQDCVDRTGRTILASFGGTYESAKTDGRKEFMRMLEFIKKSKGAVNEIMVYALDRFSRTGGAAIKLATDLREKYGVIINAVTQPVDTSNPSGVLSQGMHFLFSEFDNKLRGQRVVAGLKAKFEMGIWAVKPPQGYDSVKINGERKLVVNAEGKIIVKAFQWKIDGMRNVEIVERLKALGLKNMHKMQVQRILSNPFYCGMIAHGMLNGKVIEGQHEKMISRSTFLKINSILENSTRFNISHNPDDIKLPLKVFVWCLECKQPLTGYKAKVKVREGAEPQFQYYYKCRTKGCCFNKNVKDIHNKFEELIASITIKPELIEPLLFQLEKTFYDLNAESKTRESSLKQQLKEIEENLDKLKEGHFIKKEIDKSFYEKYLEKYTGEASKILQQLENCSNSISNPKAVLRKAVEFACNLLNIWRNGGIRVKEKLQKLIFPKGLAYDKKIGVFRTDTMNSLIFEIARLSGDLLCVKTQKAPLLEGQSRSAERAGFEPAIPLRVYKLSRLARSTTLTPLRIIWTANVTIFPFTFDFP